MRTVSSRAKSILAVTVATAATVVGVAAPSFAGQRHDDINNVLDGWDSANWRDYDGDDSTRVTVRWCTREFRVNIRKNKAFPQPDPVIGTEWMNCLSYDDAVYSDSNPAPGTYHYEVHGMDGSCFCDYRTTAGADIYW